MHMPEGDPHPSTLPGFRVTRDSERAVTRSRSGKKKKRVKFEDVQQPIPIPPQENYPQRFITQLPDNVTHIYYSGNELTFQMANDTVPLEYLAAVADLDKAAQYDWGSAILASLYHGLDTAVTTGGAITGFSQLFEYWFYEYCGVGHLIVKEDVKFSAYPRLREWERGNKKKTNDQAHNLFTLGRYLIDHRTIETITWQPWLESAVSELDDVLIASLLSRKKMPLHVPNGNCEYYLGDRCWRQLTGTAGIPLYPLINMSPHISPANLQAMRQIDFLDCEQFAIGEERETYAPYWADQTAKVGHLLTDSQRMENIYLFGPSALRASITPVVVTSASVHSLS
ncbi:hypothetical protein GIB67_029938 [Kingdonia uniflora]|uniref:Aminotransferase-like plant mobile domain-containing protein n=1 Tax=Kingdonia uniflora TaxID=39325 RepID=A0A7J7MY16_9MAGN|nr:hypothetical protein GIB67_029938 [Kingdonia uniflora]